MTNSLQLLLILLAVAVGVVVLCRILRLPAMLGYLLVGILIGPHALGWIPDAPETRHLAEFGVVFLMFSIGLEFSLARLRSMQRLVFGLGTAQVVATILLVMLTSLFFGLDWRAGLALGGVLALSLIHISEPTRLGMISYAVFCLQKKNKEGQRPPDRLRCNVDRRAKRRRKRRR